MFGFFEGEFQFHAANPDFFGFLYLMRRRVLLTQSPTNIKKKLECTEHKREYYQSLKVSQVLEKIQNTTVKLICIFFVLLFKLI
jgi:hypothetical protein